MREFILRNAQQVQTDAIDRGPLMLWDREVWLSRYRSYMRRNLTKVIVVLLLELTIFVVLITVSIVSLSLVDYYRTLHDRRRGGPAPGLYDKGLEMTIYPNYSYRTFLPWYEIGGAFHKTGGLGPGNIIIVGRHGRWTRRFPVDVMGTDGLSAVLARIGPSRPLPVEPPRTAPPRLVLYGHTDIRGGGPPVEETAYGPR